MARVKYTAQILPDGHLSCPETVKRRLRLATGAEVTATLENNTGTDTRARQEQADRLYGLTKGSKVSSDAFARRKMREIELENGNGGR